MRADGAWLLVLGGALAAEVTVTPHASSPVLLPLGCTCISSEQRRISSVHCLSDLWALISHQD